MNIKTIEPDASTPHGLLLAAAEGLYGAPEEMTPEARQIAGALIDGVLSAAHAGGFLQTDILATMLAGPEITQRSSDLARVACDAAGATSLRHAFGYVGLAEIITWRHHE